MPGPGNARGAFLRRAAVALVLLYVLSGLYAVRPAERVVIRRLGIALPTAAAPGLHYSFPWPIDRRSRVRVREPKQVTIGFAAADEAVGASTDPKRSRFLTGDENVVQVRMVVQYVAKDATNPAAFLFRAQDVRRVVETAAQRALVEVLAAAEVDALLTQAKLQIAEGVRQRTQASLDRLAVGVLVTSVNIPAAEPPAEVAADFQDVASARVDYHRIIDEAEAYAAETVPRAEGEAARLRAEAEGYRAKVVNEAQGDSAHFLKLYEEYARAREVTASRLYVETMERLLPKMRVVVADEREGAPLDLSVVRNEP